METDITTSSNNASPQTESRCSVYPPALDNASAAFIVCRFYQLGCCRRGTSCRFVHPTDGESGSILREGSAKAPVPEGPTISAATTTTGQSKKTGTNSTCPATTTKTLSTTSLDPSKWINAPVFVPRSRMAHETCQQASKVEPMDDNEAEYVDENEEEPNVPDAEDAGGARGLSYASIVRANNNDNEWNHGPSITVMPLCPVFEEFGSCALPNCKRKNGLKCDLCERYCMHPDDPVQRQMHTAECIKQHEAAMEHSFAVQRSFDKTCGICLEVILEKRIRERRFGILPNCKHIFCLSCIRTWRKANNFENKIKRGCPTCRIASDFVCPSYVWIESDEDKKKLIDDYKTACNATDCMHFKKGTAKCPFGNKCFYRHALVTGELIDVGAPPRRRERTRRRASQGFRLEELFEQFLAPGGMGLDEHGATFLTDDDDSDFDDFDLYDLEMHYDLQDDIQSFDTFDTDDELLLSYFEI